MSESESTVKQPHVTRLVAAVAGLLISGAGNYFVFQKQHIEVGSTALVLGALIAVLALGRPNRSDEPSLPTVGEPFRWGLRTWMGILVALTGVALFSYAITALYRAWELNFDWAAPLSVAAVVIWSVGLSILDKPLRNTVPVTPLTWWEVAGVVALMGLATFMRFHNTDFYPPPDGFCAVEEPQSGNGAYDIFMRGARPWEFLLDRWMPVPFYHWMGVSIWSLRLPFIIVSILTVLVTYILARQLVSPAAALFASVLLAGSRWHLNYAALAHNIFPTTILVIAVYALLVRSYRRGGLAVYPWIGFISGYTLFTYAGYRATPVVAGAFLLSRFAALAWRWRARTDPGEHRAIGRQLGIHVFGMLLAAVALAGPVAALIPRILHNPAYYLEAANRSYQNKDYYVQTWSTWLWLRLIRVWDTARIFNHFGDTIQSYNYPGMPMVDPITGVLHAAGWLFCLFWWRHKLQGYFLFAFTVLLLSGTVITQTLVVCRLQGIVPLVYILIAFFADRFGQVTTATLGPRSKPVLAILGTLIAVPALALNYDAFFNKTANNKEVRQAFRNQYSVGASYLNGLPDGTYVMMFSEIFNFFMPNDYSFLIGSRVPGHVTLDLGPLLEGKDGPWKDRDLRVLLQLEAEERLRAKSIIEKRFPKVVCDEIRHPEGIPPYDMTSCRITGFEGAAISEGVEAKYYYPNQERPFLQRIDPQITFSLFPDACRWPATQPERPCRVEWTGNFVVPADGTYEFNIETRLPTQTQLLVDGVTPSGPIALKAGEHSLQLDSAYKGNEINGTRLSIRVPGDPVWKALQFTQKGAIAAATP